MSADSMLPSSCSLFPTSFLPVQGPLVAAQPGIWIADQLNPHPNAYAVAHAVELQGDMDIALLVTAIHQGLSSIDTLSMQITELNGQPVQHLDPARPIASVQCLDLRQKDDPEAEAHATMLADLHSDLRWQTDKPNYVHWLIQTGEHHWFWYQRYHHLLVDGFSFTAITRQIAECYTALVRQQPVASPPLTSFHDVITEYQAYQQSADYAVDRQFWTDYTQTLPPPVTLAPQPLAGQTPSPRVHRHTVTLNAAQTGRLQELGNDTRQNVTYLSMALVAAWLSRMTGQPQLATGLVLMRRVGSMALTAAGPVINVVPMAVQVDPGATLTTLASQISKTLRQIRKHQRYDGEQIARDRGQAGDQSPLFGPVLNLKMFDFRLDFAGVRGITHQLASGPVRDMEIDIYPVDNGCLTLEILANAERYDPDTLARQLEHLPLLLDRILAQPEQPLDTLSILTEREQQLLAQINQTEHPVSGHTLVSRLILQAGQTPDRLALIDARHQLNYRQMREQVVALAAHLRTLGIQRGDRVAVALPRSVYLSLALMAILENGATYLPLDTDYPDDRLHLMLEDSAARLLITTRDQQRRFHTSETPVFCYETLLPATSEPTPADQHPVPQDAAYMIYTSGSTGRPKGVIVGHEAIVNRLEWMQHQYPLGADDVVLQKTPCSFDVSVWEFFWPLMEGAQLVMAPPEAHRDPVRLQQLFADYQVTTTHFVPSMLAAFVSALTDTDAIARCRSLQRVFCSGEALPTELSRQWERLTHVPLHNLYGPTEAAVDVSYYPAFGRELARVTSAHVPIGFPVWNTQLQILDHRLQPVAIGVAGDLYLCGIQLAHGYFNRPELTASRFIANPFATGERMYRTGDVARWLPNGAVEYLGRSDDQLKLRGQRIELSEIDHALSRLDGVVQAVTHACVLNDAAVVNGSDARQLVGYVQSDAGQILDMDSLRHQLAAQLPAYMVPVAIIQLDDWPLSANGKLDRRALPLPQLGHAQTGRAPAEGLEQQIAQAFCDLLQIEQVSADDDFFALGGHSLLAMQLAAKLRQTLGQSVTIGQIMVASTVAGLAVSLARIPDEALLAQAGFERLLPLRHSQGPTLYCFHPASGFAWQFSVLQRYLPAGWSITGIQSPDPTSPLHTSDTMQQMCDAHLLTLRTAQPHGPYYLLGYSLGGTLAHNIAAQLGAQGETVAFLGLLDTYPPETQNWDEKLQQNILDPEVLAEIERERAQFMAAQEAITDPELAAQQQRLFSQIADNYADSVRLLATARSQWFAGHATLFVATETLPEGMNVQKTWQPYVGELTEYWLPCAHVSIISPDVFQQLGPQLSAALEDARQDG